MTTQGTATTLQLMPAEEGARVAPPLGWPGHQMRQVERGGGGPGVRACPWHRWERPFSRFFEWLLPNLVPYFQVFFVSKECR